MASSDFLPFGNGSGANVVSQADYAALSSRSGGFASGMAKSAQVNKVWRQTSAVSAAIGQMIADLGGQDVHDDGDTATLLAQLKSALEALGGIPEWNASRPYPVNSYVRRGGTMWKSIVASTGQDPSTSPSYWISWGLTLADLQNAYSTFSTDTGTANTVVAAFWPAITALADGMQLRVKIKATNTGTATLKCNDLPARAIVGLAGSALQGGELVANGRALLMYSATRDSFVLLSCEGAAQSQSGLPLLFPLWCPNRSAIPAGYAPADGQALSRSLYPDAWAGIAAGNVPVATDAAWLATPTERGKFTAGDGSTTFRLPDYNGKSAGSLGAVFMRGDGALSAGTDGMIQGDAIRNIVGEYCDDIFRRASLESGAFFAGRQVTSTGAAGSTGAAYSFRFDASRVVPTGADNRPLNVTGCWVIRLFGAVVNPGAADAAQLATEVSKLGSDKVPFAAFLGVNQSLASSGYQKLPGGLTLQWGLYSIAAATNVAITYPIAFPVGTLVAGAFLPSAAIPVSTQAWTATGLSVYAGASVTTSGVWFALGK